MAYGLPGTASWNLLFRLPHDLVTYNSPVLQRDPSTATPKNERYRGLSLGPFGSTPPSDYGETDCTPGGNHTAGNNGQLLRCLCLVGAHHTGRYTHPAARLIPVSGEGARMRMTTHALPEQGHHHHST